MSDKKMVLMPKEEYDRLEAAWQDEKLRADTIHSRIQGVNDALLVSEARVLELESEDWCRTALKYQARIKELESARRADVQLDADMTLRIGQNNYDSMHEGRHE
jgi:hypothetical protein